MHACIKPTYLHSSLPFLFPRRSPFFPVRGFWCLSAGTLTSLTAATLELEAMIFRINVWILAANEKETEFPVESYFKHIPSVYWAQMCCITHFLTSGLHKQSVWQVTEMWNMYFSDSLHNSQISVLLNTISFSEGLIVWAVWNSNVLSVTVMYLFSSEVKGFEPLPSSR